MIKTLKSLLLHKNIMSTPDKKYGFFIFLAGTSIFCDTFCRMRFPSSFLISLFKIKLNAKFSRGSLIPLIWLLVDDSDVYVELLTLNYKWVVKGALPGLRQFLATESPLKMMKKAFYFTSKALFVLEIFKIFGHVWKRLD